MFAAELISITEQAIEDIRAEAELQAQKRYAELKPKLLARAASGKFYSGIKIDALDRTFNNALRDLLHSEGFYTKVDGSTLKIGWGKE